MPSPHPKQTATAPAPKPRKPPRKPCLNCGNLFTKNRPNRKFCSPKCKDDWHNTGGVSFAKYAAAVETRVRRAQLVIEAATAKVIAEQIRAAENRINANLRARQQTMMRLLKRLRIPPEVIEQLKRDARTDAKRSAAEEIAGELQEGSETAGVSITDAPSG